MPRLPGRLGRSRRHPLTPHPEKTDEAGSSRDLLCERPEALGPAVRAAVLAFGCGRGLPSAAAEVAHSPRRSTASGLTCDGDTVYCRRISSSAEGHRLPASQPRPASGGRTPPGRPHTAASPGGRESWLGTRCLSVSLPRAAPQLP